MTEVFHSKEKRSKKTSSLVMLAAIILTLGVSTLIPSANAIAQPGSWSTKAPRPAGGEGLGSTSIGTTVYAVGGLLGFNRNDAYETISNTWTSKASLPIGINEPAGVVSVSGRMYVISGLIGVTCSGGVSNCMTNAVQVYDPSTNTWSTAAPIPTPRSHAGVAVAGSKIYVIGGYQLLGTAPPDPTTTTGPALSVVEAYDTIANSWTTLAPMTTAREGLLAAVFLGLAGPVIFTIGGLTSPRNGTTATGKVEAYSPTSNTWTGWNLMPTPRGIVMGGLLCSDTIFTVGGENNNTSTLNTNEAFTPNVWATHPVMPTARAEGGAAIVQNTIYVVGGYTDHPGGVETNVNEAYTPVCPISASPSSLTIPLSSSDTSTITLRSTYSLSTTVTLGSYFPLIRPVGVDVNPSTNRVYVPNHDSNIVSVINGSTNTVVSNIGLGSIGSRVAVNPSANRIYVTNPSVGSVSVIDGSANTLVTTIGRVSTCAQCGIAVNPSTNRIYTVGSNVTVIDGSTNTIIATIGITRPFFVSINPSTNRIYVTNQSATASLGTVSVIDGSTNTIVAVVGVGNLPEGVAVNPVTNRIYVANEGGGPANFNAGSVSVIDGSSNSAVAEIDAVLFGPFGVSVNSATNRIFVTNDSVVGDVADIDGSSNTVVTRFFVQSQPFAVSVNPNTNKVYVANTGPSTMSVIDGSSDAVVATIGVGLNLALSPASVTLPAHGTANSTLTVSTSTTTLTGTYTVVVFGTIGGAAGNYSQGVRIPVTVMGTDFSISATSACSGPNCSPFATITLTAFNGFSGSVTLTDMVPAGLSCDPITPSSVTLPPWPATAKLSCTASTAGNYDVKVIATSGTLVHSANATFTCSTAGAACSSVGGEIEPVNKFALLAPYIGFVSVIAAATVLTAVYLRRVRSKTNDD